MTAGGLFKVYRDTLDQTLGESVGKMCRGIGINEQTHYRQYGRYGYRRSAGMLQNQERALLRYQRQ